MALIMTKHIQGSVHLFAIFIAIVERAVSTVPAVQQAYDVNKNDGECQMAGQRGLPALKETGDTHDAFSVWENGDIWALSVELECSREDPFAYSHIHVDEGWKIFNAAYHRALIVTTPSIPKEYEGDGFQVPVEIKFTPGAGRGIFATTPLEKGTLVWKPLNTAQFSTGMEFRLFLKYLPKKFACDVLIWSYAVKVSSVASDNSSTVDVYNVFVDLDSGALFNTASYPSERNLEVRDVVCDQDDIGCKNDAIYTTRDIAPGEGERHRGGASCFDT
jgi:hypothetical protein